MKITNFSQRWFKKIIAPALGVLSVVSISPLAIIACSNQANSSGITQAWINQKYQSFQNALLVNPTKFLFAEYFDQSNLDENGRFEISPEIVQKLFNLEQPENDPAIKEKYYGKIEANQLIITYELISDNKVLTPTFALKPQVVSNLQTLTEQQKTTFKKLETNWTNHTIEIKNDANKLEKNQYNTIGVNLLKTEQNDETNKFFSETLKKFKNDNKSDWENNQWTLKFAITFNDIKNGENTEGEISIKLDIYNDDYWNLPLIVNEPGSAVTNHTKKIGGFKSNQKHQEEIIALYQPLGKFYDLSEFNSNKPYKQLASSIYDIEQLGILLDAIEKLDTNNKFDLPEYFDKSKNDPTNSKNLWYKLETEINANDINGTTNIDFTIVDNFTGVKIRPQNVTKIMTLTKFFPLVNNRDNPTDYATMENIFQAYKLFEKINLKEKLKELPSKFTTNIDFNFLKDKTDFSKQNKEFDITFNDNKLDGEKPKFTQTNKFRIFKINDVETKTNKQSGPSNPPAANNDLIKNDDVNGIKEVPVLLQIQLDMDAQPDQPNGPNNKQNEWYTVLPHTKSSTSTGDVFSSKSEEIRYAKIGGFRTKEIDLTNKIYKLFEPTTATPPAPPVQPPQPQPFIQFQTPPAPVPPPAASNSKQIEIQVKESIFNSLISQTQKAAINSLESQQLITDEVKKILAASNDDEIKNDVDNIIKKYSFFFDLKEIPLKADKDTSGIITKLKTDPVDLKLTAKTNSDKIFDNIDTNGAKQPFPKVEIIISKSTN